MATRARSIYSDSLSTTLRNNNQPVQFAAAPHQPDTLPCQDSGLCKRGARKHDTCQVIVSRCRRRSLTRLWTSTSDPQGCAQTFALLRWSLVGRAARPARCRVELRLRSLRLREPRTVCRRGFLQGRSQYVWKHRRIVEAPHPCEKPGNRVVDRKGLACFISASEK
jgi:hypothetical protein